MIFCLLLVNLLSNEEQLDNLIDYSFPETSNPYLIDIDQDYLDSCIAKMTTNKKK